MSILEVSKHFGDAFHGAERVIKIRFFQKILETIKLMFHTKFDRSKILHKKGFACIKKAEL